MLTEALFVVTVVCYTAVCISSQLVGIKRKMSKMVVVITLNLHYLICILINKALYGYTINTIILVMQRGHIGIYSTMTVWGPKHVIKENKHENHTNPLHTFRKCFIIWSHFIIFAQNQCWLFCHSMAFTARCSSQDWYKFKWAWILRWWNNISYQLPLVAQWINFCLICLVLGW